jgi:hypothetical protein
MPTCQYPHCHAFATGAIRYPGTDLACAWICLDHASEALGLYVDLGEPTYLGRRIRSDEPLSRDPRRGALGHPCANPDHPAGYPSMTGNLDGICDQLACRPAKVYDILNPRLFSAHG